MERSDLSGIASTLEGTIRMGKARVGTIGLGYVGLPLSVEFAGAGLAVTGFDLTEAKVAAVNRGESYIKDVPSARLAAEVAAGRLKATSNFDELSSCDAIIIFDEIFSLVAILPPSQANDRVHS